MRTFLGIYLLLGITAFSVSFAQEDDNLEKQFDSTTQDLSNLEGEQLKPIGNEEFAEGEKQKKAVPEGLQDSFVSNMMTGVMKQVVSEFLKENPFSKMDREEVKSMIKLRMNGLPVEKLFEKNPKLLDMLVDWIRDKKALPKIIGIVNKPKEVKIYSFVVIAIFVLSFILNLVNSKGNLGKRILNKIGIFLGAFIINLGTFYFLFREELKPSLDIILKYYHL